MKLLSRDISVTELLQSLEGRLRARGLLSGDAEPIGEMVGVEPRVDPLAFNLRALETHADPTEGLPLHTHRGGVGGTAVLFAKRLFRKSCQLLINETLGRQRIFNGHVRDAYAQLAAEVAQLKKELAETRLPQQAKAPKKRALRPAKAKGRRLTKRSP